MPIAGLGRWPCTLYSSWRWCGVLRRDKLHCRLPQWKFTSSVPVWSCLLLCAARDLMVFAECHGQWHPPGSSSCPVTAARMWVNTRDKQTQTKRTKQERENSKAPEERRESVAYPTMSQRAVESPTDPAGEQELLSTSY